MAAHREGEGASSRRRRPSSSSLSMPSVRDGRDHAGSRGGASRPNPSPRRGPSGRGARSASSRSSRPSPEIPRKTPHARNQPQGRRADTRPKADPPRRASARGSAVAANRASSSTRGDRGSQGRLSRPRTSRGGNAPAYAAVSVQSSASPRRQRRAPLAIAVIVAAALLAVGGFGIDHLLNGDRIYQGVSVGAVDVSGMTRDEAADALAAAYGDKVATGRGIVFASDEAAATVDVDTALAEEEAQAEQLSVEEARANKQLWVAEAGALGARVPVGELAEEAFAIGRDGGPLQRFQAATQTMSVSVRVVFDEEALEALALQIDETIGEPRVDCNVTVEEGAAAVTEGHDGTIVDRDEFRSKLSQGFLGDTPADFSFVAHVAFAPQRIGPEEAESVRAAMQAALDRGLTVAFEGNTWDLSGTDIGPWMATRVEEDDQGARLVPFLSEKEACADLLGRIRDAGFVSAVAVSFQNDNGEVQVVAREGSRYPLVADAVASADQALFGSFRENGSADADAQRPQATVPWGEAPERSSFDEALDMGLIGVICSYTTEYNDGPGTANRRHNIHLAADLLTDSIAAANGGVWSFSETMGGQADESMGFKGAHVISGGEYTDAIGGGICQVATTVFNAVYEAGYPVTERRNHSLYISSYPTGRDAAIAYPDLDLKWENDTDSDVLLRTRYTDSTLTVTLYGIDPGYVVSTKTGDWREGEPYKTKTKVDENEPEGTRYVKTKGADGRVITVHRTVRDRAGNLVHEEDFDSNYKPVNEVIVVGPNTPATDGDDEEETSQEKDSDDKEDARVSTGD